MSFVYCAVVGCLADRVCVYVNLVFFLKLNAKRCPLTGSPVGKL